MNRGTLKNSPLAALPAAASPSTYNGVRLSRGFAGALPLGFFQGPRKFGVFRDAQ